jgi:hypothetical protein
MQNKKLNEDIIKKSYFISPFIKVIFINST